ncbi:hypothetical protein Tdes44962_MAKER06721 [Teratosphaeria destructans]|uniref:Secreted protein n=1 Tax=Teratosphaeria destructans TaxID=418781 RepID=A0A9W7T1N4_9PEZI|nr:hypothetical protein Tdes44962_MAKER06721 [Teratosphaeria destructans]
MKMRFALLTILLVQSSPGFAAYVKGQCDAHGGGPGRSAYWTAGLLGNPKPDASKICRCLRRWLNLYYCGTAYVSTEGPQVADGTLVYCKKDDQPLNTMRNYVCDAMWRVDAS